MQILILVCLIASLTSNLLAEKRTASVEVNPFCDKKCDQLINGSSINLVWIKLEGNNDTIHYLYSTLDAFTFMVFRTNVTSKLTIDWNDFLSRNMTHRSIRFNPEPLDYSGYSIPYIYEFDDRKGVANMTLIPNNQSYWIIHKTSDLKWAKFRPITNSSGLFEAKSPRSQSGLFKFTIKYPGLDNTRDTDLPHLLLNSGSNSVDFIIDSIQPVFNHSKFAINFVLFDGIQMSASLSKKQTLDDEFTPGTFNLWNVEMSVFNSSRVNSYIEWRPIFYYDDPRILENSTITLQYELKSNQTIPNGLADAFIDQRSFGYSFNVSFGSEGDDKDGYFYPNYNYSAWSFSVGLSRAPVDKMSNLVSLVIAIGFGLPAFIVIVGLFGLMVRKLRRNQYSQI